MVDEQTVASASPQGGIDFKKLAERLVPAKWNSVEGALAAVGLGAAAIAVLYFGLPIIGGVLTGAAMTVAGLTNLAFQTIKLVLAGSALFGTLWVLQSKPFRDFLRRNYLAAFFRLRRWQIQQDPVAMLFTALQEQEAIYVRGRSAVMKFAGSVQREAGRIEQLKKQFEELSAKARAMRQAGHENQAILLAEQAMGIQEDLNGSVIPEFHRDRDVLERMGKAVDVAHLRIGRMRNNAERYQRKMANVEQRRAARRELGEVFGTSESAQLFSDSVEEIEQQLALDLAEGFAFDQAIAGVVAEAEADKFMLNERGKSFLDELDRQGAAAGAGQSTTIAEIAPMPEIMALSDDAELNSMRQSGGRQRVRA